MTLPQDLANILAITIRDVIWYKNNVFSFLEKCGVPSSIMLELKRNRKEATIKLIHKVLDDLGKKGDEGWTITRKMLTEMHYWKDIHSIEVDRKSKAVNSLKELQKAYRQYQSQQEYRKHQEETERQMHSDRLQRDLTSELDHKKLNIFRDEFDRIHAIIDAHQRGNEFEKLMNDIFKYYCQDSKGSFNRIGEQIDGLFKLDHHWHYVEIRWRKDKSSAADISVLRDRARESYGGDTKALFVSINGFSDDCKQSLTGKSDERVILMDGFDLRCVLDCQIAFDVLIAEKQAEVIRSKKAFIGVNEIMKNRAK